MPYKLRNCTCVANTDLSLLSVTSSVTLEHAKPATDSLTLKKRSEIRRLKRGFGVLSKEVAYKLYFLRIGNTKLISIGLVKYDL
jgi:hypothetical protein